MSIFHDLGVLAGLAKFSKGQPWKPKTQFDTVEEEFAELEARGAVPRELVAFRSMMEDPTVTGTMHERIAEAAEVEIVKRIRNNIPYKLTKDELPGLCSRMREHETLSAIKTAPEVFAYMIYKYRKDLLPILDVGPALYEALHGQKCREPWRTFRDLRGCARRSANLELGRPASEGQLKADSTDPNERNRGPMMISISPASLPLQSTAPNPAVEAERRETFARLHRQLALLPDRLRLPLCWQFEFDPDNYEARVEMSLNDIAQRLGVSPHIAKKLITQALAIFRNIAEQGWHHHVDAGLQDALSLRCGWHPQNRAPSEPFLSIDKVAQRLCLEVAEAQRRVTAGQEQIGKLA